ncbi:MAG: hypothetical protein JXR97_00710 [Planctomycetes bacterium]|nr:hypothetical protein [Planctomycetota bacterium]
MTMCKVRALALAPLFLLCWHVFGYAVLRGNSFFCWGANCKGRAYIDCPFPRSQDDCMFCCTKEFYRPELEFEEMLYRKGVICELVTIQFGWCSCEEAE